MNIQSIPHVFTVDEKIYNLAHELEIDTSANVEDEFPLPVYKITCTQQEYILLKHMAEEGNL